VTAARPSLVSVLAASALTLILVGRSGGPLAAGEAALRSVARAAFAPVEAAGEAAFRPLEGAVSGLGWAGDLAQAEAALGRERERTRSEAARAEALAAENGRLTTLLGLDSPAGADGVAARVVSTGAGRSAGTLMIDRGDGAGIRVGMPVVAAGGLVGRVVEVGPRHSTVLPVTNPASAVGVRIAGPAEGSDGAGPAGRERVGAVAAEGESDGAGRGPATCVAQGRGGRTLRLDLLDPTAELERGDLAVTSGLRHSRFPAGLPVGRVSGTRGRFVVEPFAPPDRLEMIKVLRWEPVP
jgi:rod shape-determining protein MreC